MARRRLGLGRGLALSLFLGLGLMSCAENNPAAFPDTALTSTNAPTTAHAATRGAAETVFIFYSEHCPCVAAHIERLRALQATYGDRNVRFWFIDSEVGASVARDTDLAKARHLPFEMLIDTGGHFARAAGAEYASYVLVVDADGRVRYHGGIDSDKSHLTGDSVPYLQNALEDLVSGRDVRLAEGKTLGCSLELP